MADKKVRRFIQAIFDRVSAKKAEAELEASLAKAGKQGGENFLRELRAAFDKRMADLKTQLAKGLIDPKQFRAQANLAAKEFNTGVIAGMEKARAAGTLTDREYLKLSRTLKRVGDEGGGAAGRITSAFLKAGTAIAGFFALSRIESAVAAAVRDQIAQQQSASRLDVVLQKLGLTYRQVSDEVERYLDRLQKSTRFSDEDGREALVNLVTITGDYTKALSLLDITADVATKRHTSMAEAADAVGKASRGMTRGLQDLGIRVGDTGDLVAKLRANLGGLAAREGVEAGGQIAILKNLLGEVSESFGGAILGSSNLSNSVGDLKTALIDLNTWMKGEGGTTIRSFVNLLVIGAKGIGQALASGGTIQGAAARRILDARRGEERARSLNPSDAMQLELTAAAIAQGLITAEVSKGAAKRRAITTDEQRTLAKITDDGGTELAKLTAADLAAVREIHKAEGQGLITLAKDQADAVSAILKAAAARDKKEREDRARELGAELTRIQTEIAVKTLMVEQGLTDALARERVRRDQILHPPKPKEGATTADVAAGLADLDKASLLVAAGLNDRTTPAVKEVTQAITDLELVAIPAAKEMTREEFIRQAAFRAGIDVTTDAGQAFADLASQQFDNATKFATPWVKAMDVIRNEIEGSGTLLRELGEAWAQGGFMGIVALAKAKIKENLAWVIEQTAKAFGNFALGNVAAGVTNLKSAAGHGAAAVAWAAAAKVAGGGGGASAGGGGSFSAGTPNLQRAADTKAAAPEITIVLTGPGFHAMNPEVQEVLYGAMQQARERYGQDAHIRIKGAP